MTGRVTRRPTCWGWRCTRYRRSSQRFASGSRPAGSTMPEINRRQALVPEGGSILANRRGTAPGLWIPAGERAVVLLPGPPREMQPMLDGVVASHVAPRWGAGQTAQRSVVVGGRSESWVDERVQPLYAPWRLEPIPVHTTILASLGQVELHLTAHGPDRAALDARLAAAVATLAAALGDDAREQRWPQCSNRSSAICLRARGWRLAVAESCTGGLVTSRLTDVSGSSDYVDRAVVAYSNRAKVADLDVSPDLIDGARRRERTGGGGDGRGAAAPGRRRDRGRGDGHRRAGRRQRREARRHRVPGRGRCARPGRAHGALHRRPRSSSSRCRPAPSSTCCAAICTTAAGP